MLKGSCVPDPNVVNTVFRVFRGLRHKKDIYHRFATMEQSMHAAQVVITPSTFLSEDR